MGVRNVDIRFTPAMPDVDVRFALLPRARSRRRWRWRGGGPCSNHAFHENQRNVFDFEQSLGTTYHGRCHDSG